jgi:hypothetical protein
MEQFAWCFVGAVIVLFGLFCLVMPAASVPLLDDEDNPRDPVAPPSTRELRRARLIGLVFIVIGLIWLYFVLFGTPTNDPVLV